MSEVKSIGLIFENCEYVDFDRADIGQFWCDNVHESVSRFASNSISKYKCCDGVFMEIKNVANTTYSCYGHDMEEHKFERITNGCDVTQIVITYEDDTVETILVPWIAEDNEFINDAQTYYLSSYGNLYLMISEEDEVADEIDKEEVNSQEYDMLLDAYS